MVKLNVKSKNACFLNNQHPTKNWCLFFVAIFAILGYNKSKEYNECKEMVLMELAKVTSKGQITIPIAIRKLLGIKDGDKLLFVEKPEGIVLMNPTMMALENMGRAFSGEGERLGLENDDDVVAMVKEIRKENWEKNNENKA